MKGSTLNLTNMTGIILLLLTCVAFAGYTVLARSLSKVISPVEISYFMLGIGFAVFLIVSIISHLTAGTLNHFLSPLANGTFIEVILYLDVATSLITALTVNYIVSKIEATKMSICTNLLTVVSIAAGAMFLREKMKIYHIIGSMLIITGVLGTNHLGRKKQ